ncbi:MAG: hypothetical protein ACLPOA_11490 [Methylocella sp.]
MTSPTPTKAIPSPALLVYGKPTSPDLPQASWFRAEDRATVVAAAQSLRLSVLEIRTDAEKALTVGVHEGVLKGNGRMIVGSVTPDVYKRIEEYVAKASPAPAAAAASVEATRAKASSEQNTNNGEKGTAASSTGKAPPTVPEKLTPDPWAALRVGSHVVAKHWYDGEANGWWIAEITAVEGSDFVIRWLDEPNTPPLKIERKHVAILHPDFDVAREWDRKPTRRG